MDSDIFEYAVEGLKRKKKITISVFLVLCVSFSFLIYINSLMGSITKTNDELLRDLYGEWNIGLQGGRTTDGKWAQEQEGYISCGSSKNYGFISVNNKKVGFGIVDGGLISVGRLGLTSGRWPENEFEIVMEADELLALGYIDEIGQTVSLGTFLYNNASSEELYYRDKYTVVGILNEYTDIWAIDSDGDAGFLNAVITSDATIDCINNRLIEEFNDDITLKSKTGYFIKFQKEKIPGICEELDSLGRKYIYNHNSEIQIEHNNVLYSIIIIIVTVAATSIVFMLGLSDMVRSYSIMRSIGATKKQLAKLILYETVLLCLPAVIPGTVFAVVALDLTLRLIVFSGSVKIIISIPWLAIALDVILWAGAVAATKFCIYNVACKNDLSGRMQISHKKTGVYRILRTAAGYLICICFGTITVFIGIKAEELTVAKNKVNNTATYRILAIDYSSLPQDAVESIGNIPGVKNIYSCLRYMAEYPEDYGYPGPEMLYVIDDDGYTEREFGRHGIDTERFNNGDIMVVCIPVSGKNENPIVPGKMKVKILAGVGGMRAVPLILDEIETDVAVCYVPDTMFIRDGLSGAAGWSFASVRFLEKHDLLSRKDKVGYFIYAYHDERADAVTVDRAVAGLCKEKGLLFSSSRAQNEAESRVILQRLLKLLFVGVGTETVTVFLLCSLCALERQHSVRKYMILRSLGMSKKQWKISNLYKAAGNGAAALIGGWGLFGLMYGADLKDFIVCNGNSGRVCICVSAVILFISVAIRYSFGVGKRRNSLLMNE